MFQLPILVAEADQQLRTLICVILSKAGLPVLEAVDGAKALATVEESKGEIGVVVTSYTLPRMDGPTLARRVKERFPSIPILLMSSDGNASNCNESDAFLAKPFAPSVLADTVRRLGEMRRYVLVDDG